MLTTLKSQKNNIYCPLIYQGMYIERQNSTTSVVAPCCAAKGQRFSNDQISFDSNSFLQRLREENKSGIASAECSECWNNEKYHGTSRRLMTSDSNLNDNSFVSLDWNVEPICNAKCIICSGYYSSAWLAEDAKYNNLIQIRSVSESKRNTIIDTFDFTALKQVYFNGGEPVLSQDPVDILQKLDSLGRLPQVVVGLNMNGSTMPSRELIELLKKAKKVRIFVSIDGTKEQFEYIRNPLKWADLEKNVEQLIKLEFDEVHILTALGIHNLQIAAEIEQWRDTFTAQFQNNTKVTHIYQLVQGILAISNASTAVRDQILVDLGIKDRDLKYFNLGVNCLKTATGNDQWIAWLEQLDQRRNLNWKETFPALYNSVRTAGAVK